MRGMRRFGLWTLNGLTVLSLLLCAATCVLWVRSHMDEDAISYRGSSTRWAIYSGRGEFNVMRGRFLLWPYESLPHQRMYWTGETLLDARELRFLWPDWTWTVPMFSVLVWTAALPTWRYAIPWARRRDAKRGGWCAVCHYNLTANVSGVCPECGTAIRNRG